VSDVEERLAQLVMVLPVGQEGGGGEGAVLLVGSVLEGIDGGKLFALQLNEFLGSETK
jgi:hypothetical protein